MIACKTGCIRAALIGLALFGLAGNALAKDPPESTIALARELIDLKGDSGIYDPVLTGIIIKSRDALLQSNPMVSKDLNDVSIQIRNEFAPQLEALKRQVAVYYALNMSEQELKDVLAFYKSPVGAKLLRVEPQILNQSMAFANKWASEIADEVMARMRAEMRKKGHDL